MIAYEYANIPGATMDEIIAEAQNALATILDKTLATRSKDHYQNAAEMLAAIKRAIGH